MAFKTLKTGYLEAYSQVLDIAEIKGVIELIYDFEKLLSEREYLEGI